MTEALGPNTCVFTPKIPQATIQKSLDAIANKMVPLASQFSRDRYAILFAPGTYGSQASPLVFQVGFYTEVAGLGAGPKDVVINGQINSYAISPTPDVGGTSTSTTNFFRSLSNLTINSVPVPKDWNFQPKLGSWCFGDGGQTWSVSQAAAMRSVIVNGDLSFQQLCLNPDTGYNNSNYASGGYASNLQVSGKVDLGGQQQYYVRESKIASGGCGVWGMVYSGTIGAPTPSPTNCKVGAVVGKTPVSAEKPFLTYDDASRAYSISVPKLRRDAVGPDYSQGKRIPLKDFYIAKPGVSAKEINKQLARGANLLLTPGIYELNESIKVTKSDTVIVGLGLATLVANNGDAALDIKPSDGVKVSSIIVEAGRKRSNVLIDAGKKGGNKHRSEANPNSLHDIYPLVGGAADGPVAAGTAVKVDADYTIMDNIWAWRADHAHNNTLNNPAGKQVIGWDLNKGDTGIEVTGDNVIGLGIAVEHFQKNEVIWSGENGTVLFFQNELPYDPPTQDAWNTSKTQKGYPAFLVTDRVTKFNSWGMNSYVVFISTKSEIHNAMAFQVPKRQGVNLYQTSTVWIAGPGNSATDSVVNGVGPAANSTNAFNPQLVPVYPGP